MTEEYEKMIEAASKEALKKYENDLLEFKKTADGFLQIAACLIQNYNYAKGEFDYDRNLVEKYAWVLGYSASSRYDVSTKETEEDGEKKLIVDLAISYSNIDFLPDILSTKKRRETISSLLEENGCRIDTRKDTDSNILLHFYFDASVLLEWEAEKEKQAILFKLVNGYSK